MIAVQSAPTLARRISAATLFFCALTLLCAATAYGQFKPTLVSVRSSGSGTGNGVSGDFGRYGISADGRYVLFYSEASNLVPEDNSPDGDLFVRDMLTGKTTLVTDGAAHTPTGAALNGLISADGRYVAYTGGGVFLRDLQTGTTRRVNVNMAGTGGGILGESILNDMSPDGRFVAFYSSAKEMTPHADGNDTGIDIYIRDMQSDHVELVSVNTAGTATGNGMSFAASVSGDGRYVVFTSEASDLVANDTPTRDIFLRDRLLGTTTRVSTNHAGTAGGNFNSVVGAIDRGGRFVVFGSKATDLSPLPDVNSLADLFIYDVRTKTRKLITVNAAGNESGNDLSNGHYDHGVQFSISDDGRYVAFMSQSGDLVTNDTNGNSDDIFLYEVATQKKTLVSVNPAGNSCSIGGASNPSVSAGGRFVAFQSGCNDLVSVADEPNGYGADVFVRDLLTGKTYLASINRDGTRTANGPSFQPFISADGSRLVFFSRASNLVTADANGFKEDVFAFSFPVEGAPVLLTEANVDRAVALDSVTHSRDPFPLLATQNFSTDKRTRVSLMAWRLELQPGEDISAISALAEDEQGAVYHLPVEYLGAVPGLDSVKQVVVKLPADINDSKTLWVTLSLRGLTSNRAIIRIKYP